MGPVSLSSLMLTWWLFTADGGGRGRHGRDNKVEPARAMNTGSCHLPSGQWRGMIWSPPSIGSELTLAIVSGVE